MRMKKHFTIRAVWDGVPDAFGKYLSVTDSGLGGFAEWKNHAIYEEEKALDWIKQRIKRVEHYHQTFEETRITREIIFNIPVCLLDPNRTDRDDCYLIRTNDNWAIDDKVVVKRFIDGKGWRVVK